jgi:hypothetical protein
MHRSKPQQAWLERAKRRSLPTSRHRWPRGYRCHDQGPRVRARNISGTRLGPGWVASEVDA